MDPQNYIVVKGVLDVYDKNGVNLSMGLENGIILMVSAIDVGGSIYLNGNHFGEEVIMNSNGKL